MSSINRKLWIDVFKTIAICLVVIGHVTGQFNHYIYQFHMPAFFFISGYCTDWRKKSRLQLVWERFCALIIPFFSIFFIGVLGFWVLNLTGVYNMLFSLEMPYVGVEKTIRELFFYGNNYIYWMGATWFVWILFGVIVYHALLNRLFSDDSQIGQWIYLFVIFITYFLGFMVIQEGVKSQYALIAIGQLYFGIGNFCRTREENIKLGDNKGGVYEITGIVVAILVMWKFSKIPWITMDFPSYTFRHLFLNVIASLNGIFLVFCTSKIIERTVLRLDVKNRIGRSITVIGSNTMPIMYFHFCFFKVCMILLMLLGVVDRSYLVNFLPNEGGIGDKYLLLFLLVSLIGSIIIWKLFNGMKYIRIILGQEKSFYEKIYNYGIMHVKTLIGTKWDDFWKNNKCFFDFNLFSKFINKSDIKKEVPLFIGMLFLNFGVNVFRQGIILNDEIQHYYNRTLGWKNLLIWALNAELSQGRPLRIPADFNVAISMLFKNVYLNRFFQVLLLGFTAYAFYRLIVILFNEKIIGYIWYILVFSFWPITFEHGAPNAFNGLTALPVLELLFALILWCKYLKNEKIRVYIGMLFFWGLALGGYEFVVTYTPLFLILYLFVREKSKKSFLDMLRICFLPGIFGVLYLGGTFLCQKMFGTGYEGVQISLSNPEDIIKVISVLVSCAFPGVIPLLPKYQYLMSIYKNNINMFFLLSGILVTMVVGMGILCIDKKKHSFSRVYESLNKKLIIVCSIIIYIFIPVLPNAVTKLYQENVSFHFFSWLPISMPVFFTSCLLVAFLIRELCQRWNNVGIVILGLVVLLLGSDTQCMNRIISNQNHIDFERFSEIQKVFQTEIIEQLDDAVIGTKDLYETRNLLSIHQGYWTSYANIFGNKVQVKECVVSDIKDYDVWMAFINDEYFCIASDESAAIVSQKPLGNWAILETALDECIAVPVDNYWQDGDFFVYGYNKINQDWVICKNKNDIFENIGKRVGNTKNTIVIENGIYSDFWCEQNSKFKILSGDNGQVVLSIYYPEYENGKEYDINVMVNNNETILYKLNGPNTIITIETEPKRESQIQIDTNFLMTNKGNDIRDLSWLLEEAIGQ